MKIAFDYQTFVLQAYGGIPRYYTCLAQSLKELAQEARVFAPLHRNRYLSLLPKELRQGQYILRYPPKAVNFAFQYNKWVSRNQIARWKPDVVHETYYSRHASAPPGCPTVITVFDMIHELFKEESPAGYDINITKEIAIKRAHHVICISESTRTDLMRLIEIPEAKISVVHLGFDKLCRRGEQIEAAKANTKPYLLYVGMRSGYKNFNRLLMAVASSPKLMCDFNIVAFGGGRLTASELVLMNSLGFLKDQVLQREGDDSVLSNFYGNARAFVYPSLYEGFGIPPLEAMANNCPVVCSNTSSMPEIIGNAGEYFDPSDVDDMRRAIEAVVYSDTRIETLARLAEERLTSFSWSKCAIETLKIYDSLLQQ